MATEYNTENLPSSQHFSVGIFYSEEFKRDTYFIVNKETNLPEVPFPILSDAKAILKDLEAEYFKDGIKEVH